MGADACRRQGGNVKKSAWVGTGLAVAGAVAWAGEQLWHRDGPRGDLGAQIAPAGDFDGDGRPDLLVGEADLFDMNDWPKVSLFSSSGQLLLELGGQESGESFGQSIDALDDVNGDGTRDIVAGAPGYGTSYSLGRVYVFSGADGRIVWTREGVVGPSGQSPILGYTVRRSPDLDGDGVNDVLACSLNSGPQGEGVVHAFSGRDGRTLWERTGEGQDPFYSDFGRQIAPTQDMNGDGVADLFVSDPLINQIGMFLLSGKIYLLSGKDGSFLPFSITNTDLEYAIGHVLLQAGDLDADGVPDLVYSKTLRGPGDRSQVLAYSVGKRRVLRAFHEEQGFWDTRFGWSAAVLDYDGDGSPELAVGAPFYPTRGRVLLFSIATGRFLRYFVGEQDYSGFGRSISTARDLDGDGDEDLAVGDPDYRFPTEPWTGGRVAVYGGHLVPRTASGANGTLR